MDFNVKDIQMGVDNIANGNTVIRKSKRTRPNPTGKQYNAIFIPFCRGRSQFVHQLKLAGTAEGNEACATYQTDAGHTQFHGSPVRQDTPGWMD